MFAIEYLVDCSKKQENIVTTSIENLIFKDFIIATKSYKPLKEEEKLALFSNSEGKTILVSRLSQKECFYFSITLNDNLYFKTKIQRNEGLSEFIVKSLLQDKTIIKLLELEFENYCLIQNSITNIFISQVSFASQCTIIILKKIQSLTDIYSNKLTAKLVNDFLVLENWIRTNLHLPTPTIREMASQLNMSSSKFKLAFNKIYACSPHQYFLTLRAKSACKKLYFSNLSVSEVSFLYGFNYPSTFSRIVKSKFGISPMELNNKLKKDKSAKKD